MKRTIGLTLSGLVLLVGAAFAQTSGATGAEGTSGGFELALAWAEANAAETAGTASDQAWSAYWRNQAGGLASQVVAAKLARKTGGAQQLENTLPVPDTTMPPPPPPDPNAAFRAAATPEENLARVPAPKVTTDSDYIPKPRAGEAIGISVDYARIETMINRYPEPATSTTTVIPPVYSGWSGWSGSSWGGWSGYYGYGYAAGYHWHRPWRPPCVFAPPVYYNPYVGGPAGGFFYRSRHFAIGVGF